MTEQTYRESARELSVAGRYDVIVCGAGPAGVSAAIAAARTGADTLLIDFHGCLGGTWTAGLLTWVFDMDKPGLAMEIGKRLDEMDGRIGSQYYMYTYDVESMKLLLERMCLQSEVKIRLFTRVTSAIVEEGLIKGIITESKSGREAWYADTIVDCTGDGDVGAFAGCRWDMGSEKGDLQPWTLYGLVILKDIEAARDYVSFYQGSGQRRECLEIIGRDLDKAGIKTSYGHPTIFQVKGNLCALMINHQYRVSAINADHLSKATIEAREEVYNVTEALRSLGGVWEGLQLAATAEHIGIREARRIHGRYTLTYDDLKKGAKFDDGVCNTPFNVDIHSTDPGKDKGLKTEPVKPYDIPYRSLIAEDVDGLLMAGRCISGDWYAHASYRVTGNAVGMGQAAGTAAAIAARSERMPHELRWDEIESEMKNVVFR